MDHINRKMAIDMLVSSLCEANYTEFALTVHGRCSLPGDPSGDNSYLSHRVLELKSPWLRMFE
jgi:hypothetical protein